jgi:hypothetical protein
LGGALLSLSLSAGAQAPAQPGAAARIPELTRQAIYAELATCRATLKAEAQERYAQEEKPDVRGTSLRQRQRYYQRRAASGEQATAACRRMVMRKYKVQPAELESIKTEGAAKGWKSVER